MTPSHQNSHHIPCSTPLPAPHSRLVSPSRREFLQTGAAVGAAVLAPAAWTAATIVTAPAAHAASAGSTLPVNGQLNPGDYLQSGSGLYTLIYQSDGNLVLYEDYAGTNEFPRWASGTYGIRPAFCRLGSDGVLRIYGYPSGATSPVVVWANLGPQPSGTPYYIAVQNDGNLVEYQRFPSQGPIWASNTQRSTGNPTLTDVTATLSAVLAGPRSKPSMFRYEDPHGAAHIQGMQAYGGYVLFTHNSALTNDNGFWAVGTYGSSSMSTYDVPRIHGFQHPSSFQVIGDFAVGGLEKNDSDNTQSTMLFWDLAPIKTGKGPRLLNSPQFDRQGLGAAATGITYAGGAYVLAVFTTNGNQISFYRSNGYAFGDSRLSFGSELFRVKAPAAYDNMNLITQSDDRIFLVGMRGKSSGASFDDLVSLNTVDLNAKTVTQLFERKVDTKAGGSGGPHLRYGAGTTVLGPSTLNLYCSERLFESPTTLCYYRG